MTDHLERYVSEDGAASFKTYIWNQLTKTSHSNHTLKNKYQRVEIKNKNCSPNAFSKWGIMKHGVPQGSVLGPLLFLLCINNLSKTINTKSKQLLFAGDTSLIFKKSKYEDFKNDINIVFVSLNRWFEANKLSLNFDKTHKPITYNPQPKRTTNLIW
jgi:hypothetical protein